MAKIDVGDLWNIIKLIREFFGDVNWLDILGRLVKAYQKFRDEKGMSDPETPGEWSKAETAEMLAYLIDENIDLIDDEDIEQVLVGLADWLERYATEHGETVDED